MEMPLHTAVAIEHPSIVPSKIPERSCNVTIKNPSEFESRNPNNIMHRHGAKDSSLSSPQLSVLQSSTNCSEHHKCLLQMWPQFHCNSCVTVAGQRWWRGIKKDKKMWLWSVEMWREGSADLGSLGLKVMLFAQCATLKFSWQKILG